MVGHACQSNEAITGNLSWFVGRIDGGLEYLDISRNEGYFRSVFDFFVDCAAVDHPSNPFHCIGCGRDFKDRVDFSGNCFCNFTGFAALHSPSAGGADYESLESRRETRFHSRAHFIATGDAQTFGYD